MCVSVETGNLKVVMCWKIGCCFLTSAWANVVVVVVYGGNSDFRCVYMCVLIEIKANYSL